MSKSSSLTMLLLGILVVVAITFIPGDQILAGVVGGALIGIGIAHYGLGLIEFDKR